MSNYSKSTNFLAKDSLADSDPGKIIKGSEFDTEFNSIVTAVNSKANTASPALTGVPTAPTASSGTNSTQLATTEFVQAAADTARTYSTVQTFKDTTFSIIDNTDATKKIALELGNITTATTRTLTVADKSGTIALTSDLPVVDPLNSATNTVVTGTYAATSSTTITITATNTYTAGQIVYITFTKSSGSDLTAGNYTIATATGSGFTITYGSSVTSAGSMTSSRYGYAAIATTTEIIAGTDTTKFITPSRLKEANLSPSSPTTMTGEIVTISNVPSWARRISLLFKEVSTSGGSNKPFIRLGTSSGVDSTSTYLGTTGSTKSITTGTDTSNWSDSILIVGAGALHAAANKLNGIITLVNGGNYDWYVTGSLGVSQNNGIFYLGGSKTLASALTQLEFNIESSDTYDNGTVIVIYE